MPYNLTQLFRAICLAGLCTTPVLADTPPADVQPNQPDDVQVTPTAAQALAAPQASATDAPPTPVPGPTESTPAPDCPEPTAPVVSADTKALARAAMEAGNYAEAYYYWRPAAEQGDIEAQYGLGWMYHNGYGLAIDDRQALRWWEQAASKGNTDALFSIAMLYNMGAEGVPKNMDLAVAYYLQAAHYGHEDAKLVMRGLLGQGEAAVLKRLKTILIDDWRLLGQPLAVRVPRANIRSAPNNQARIIATLERGHELIELGRKGQWVKVGIARLGSIGWIYQTLIETPTSGASAPTDTDM